MLGIQLWPLRSLETLQNNDRVASIDAFRGLAILAVVLFHADALPYGYLGVDLFFVLSGYLVGGLLIRPLFAGRHTQYWRFIISRGFKIWPSYYAFILLGELVAFLLYRHSHADQLIPFADLPMYLLFYRNYRGNSHWSFDHIWSLCVEEHFYLMLPLLIISVQKFFKSSASVLVIGVSFFIFAGILGRIVGHIVQFETYSATHNRLDALGWGVFLFIAHQKFNYRIPPGKRAPTLIAALLALSACVAVRDSSRSEFFNAVVFQAVTPLCFTIAIFSCLDLEVRGLKALRFMGYYSFNWYLWHPMFVFLFREAVAPGYIRNIAFTGFTLAVAIFFTVFVEEPLLQLRKPLLKKFFPLPIPAERF